jgi:hypothetical protein
MVTVVLLASAVSQGKTTNPETVVDYFLLLPQKGFFELEKLERKKWLYGTQGSVVDIKNDYLRMQGDGAQGSLQVALFRYKAQVLIAVYNEFEDGTLNFLRYDKGKWKDVTKVMLPVPFNRRCTYTLPRYGTSIRVTRGNGFDYEGDGKKLYDLVWAKGRFLIRAA